MLREHSPEGFPSVRKQHPWGISLVVRKQHPEGFPPVGVASGKALAVGEQRFTRPKGGKCLFAVGGGPQIQGCLAVLSFVLRRWHQSFIGGVSMQKKHLASLMSLSRRAWGIMSVDLGRQRCFFCPGMFLSF